MLCHLAVDSLLFLSEKKMKEPGPWRAVATGVVEKEKERKEKVSDCQNGCPKIETPGAQF